MAASLSDIILSHIGSEISGIYTAMPATIVGIDDLNTRNTIQVQPAIEKDYGLGSFHKLPIIETTVQWPAGGGAVMTFPLALGDDVLVIFSMYSLAEFQASIAGTVQPYDGRMHHLTDGYAIPKVFRGANQPSPSTTDVEIRYGDSLISLKEDDSIGIENAKGSISIDKDGNHKSTASGTWTVDSGGTELVATLIQMLSQLASTPCVQGAPLVAALDPFLADLKKFNGTAP